MEHTIQNLFEENSQKIYNLLGADYLKQSAQDTLTTDQVLEANDALSDDLYGTTVSNLVKTRSFQSLDKLSVKALESVSVPESSIDATNTNQIGLVVIRPEATGLADKSRELLVNNGLRILLEKTTRINFKQYWSLYSAGLRDPESRYDFPTRTLNYINKDVQILISSGRVDGENNESISDFITDKLKGRQGAFSENTLRGHIAYNALKHLVNIDNKSFVTPEANIALDPIGAYRQLVRGKIESDRMHATAQNPLLFYAGQSMHVPDNDEIRRDIRILLSEEEIIKVTQGLHE